MGCMERQLRGRDSSRTNIAGPYSLGSIPSGLVDPVLLDSGIVVGRESRITSNPYVPIEFVRKTSKWTLETSLDGHDYVAGSPPSGWAESKTGSSAITVTSGEIVLTGDHASNGDAILKYVWPSLSAGDEYAIVFRASFDPRPSGATDRDGLRIYDSRRNSGNGELCYYIFNSAGGSQGYFYPNTSASYAVGGDATENTHFIRVSNGETDDTATVGSVLDSGLLSSAILPSDRWNGPTSVDQLWLTARGSDGSGDPEDAVTSLSWFLVYKRVA